MAPIPLFGAFDTRLFICNSPFGLAKKTKEIVAKCQLRLIHNMPQHFTNHISIFVEMTCPPIKNLCIQGPRMVE